MKILVWMRYGKGTSVVEYYNNTANNQFDLYLRMRRLVNESESISKLREKYSASLSYSKLSDFESFLSELTGVLNEVTRSDQTEVWSVKLAKVCKRVK